MISGRNTHVIAAGVAIDFGDALSIGLDHGAGQRAARLGLNFRRELFVLDLLVALKGNFADDRIFDHGHDQATARLIDLDVLEQAGLDQRFQAVIYVALVETPAGTRLEVRTDWSRLRRAGCPRPESKTRSARPPAATQPRRPR